MHIKILYRFVQNSKLDGGIHIQIHRQHGDLISLLQENSLKNKNKERYREQREGKERINRI
jgi:hypothetical protein